MKHLRKVDCIVLLTLILLFVSLSGCKKVSGSSETLTIGVRNDIMNFSYLNETTGKYYGLEIDIANELADRLGYGSVEFVTVQPDNRKEMLLNGDVDCLIATYSIAESREENFDFSAPYYTDKIILMVEKSSLFESIDDLKHKTIGILSGTSAGPLLANKLYELGLITDKVVSNTDTATEYEGASVIKTAQYKDLDVLLEEGAVDAVCMDACIANTYMDDDRTFLDTVIAEQEYGVATPKGSELSLQVEAEIQSMLDDGTIAELIDKWN